MQFLAFPTFRQLLPIKQARIRLNENQCGRFYLGKQIITRGRLLNGVQEVVGSNPASPTFMCSEAL
jgi:hypothetical protein